MGFDNNLPITGGERGQLPSEGERKYIDFGDSLTALSTNKNGVLDKIFAEIHPSFSPTGNPDIVEQIVNIAAMTPTAVTTEEGIRWGGIATELGLIQSHNFVARLVAESHPLDDIFDDPVQLDPQRSRVLFFTIQQLEGITAFPTAEPAIISNTLEMVLDNISTHEYYVPNNGEKINYHVDKDRLNTLIDSITAAPGQSAQERQTICRKNILNMAIVGLIIRGHEAAQLLAKDYQSQRGESILQATMMQASLEQQALLKTYLTINPLFKEPEFRDLINEGVPEVRAALPWRKSIHPEVLMSAGSAVLGMFLTGSNLPTAENELMAWSNIFGPLVFLNNYRQEVDKYNLRYFSPHRDMVKKAAAIVNPRTITYTEPTVFMVEYERFIQANSNYLARYYQENGPSQISKFIYRVYQQALDSFNQSQPGQVHHFGNFPIYFSTPQEIENLKEVSPERKVAAWSSIFAQAIQKLDPVLAGQ